MFERIVLSYKNLEVIVSDQANEGIIDILSHAVQGSKGGLRFSLQNIPQRIAAYKGQIRFVSLYRKGQVTGTVGSCFRLSGQGRLKYHTSYLRYLAFHSVYQSDPATRRRIRKPDIRSEKDDNFKKKTLEVFSQPHLLGIDGVEEGEKHVMYAFLENMNERSKNLVGQAGYEYIRSFLTVAFSRFSPKKDPSVSLIDSGGVEKMTSILRDFYKDYSFFTTDYSFFNDRYYVLKEKGEIVAGVCAIPSAYKIYNMPGIWGWVIMKALPKFPYFRRLFSPGEFRFIVFDSLYCRPGMEQHVSTLLESVCASEGYNTGLTWLDDRSEFYDRIRSGVRMGALNRMLNAKPGQVYARFINMDASEKELFLDAPAYISGFDFS